eukprot:3334426-Amphidinium_carterae.1
MNDLQHVAEHEHRIAREVLHEGRQFFSYIEQQARGFVSSILTGSTISRVLGSTVYSESASCFEH